MKNNTFSTKVELHSSFCYRKKGVVVYGYEWYWGGTIMKDRPHQTPYGTPTKTIEIGKTQSKSKKLWTFWLNSNFPPFKVPFELFEDFITEISPQYTFSTYSLLSNNCNNFSQTVVQFLCGKDIPSDILNLPEDALNGPQGKFHQFVDFDEWMIVDFHLGLFFCKKVAWFEQWFNLLKEVSNNNFNQEIICNLFFIFFFFFLRHIQPP